MSVDLFLKLFTLFVVVGIGYGAARAGLTGGVVGLRTPSNIGFLVFVPGLLFRTTATVDLAALLVRRLLAAFFVPLLLWALGVWVWQRRRMVPGTDDPAAPATRAVTLSFGNSVQAGLPFAAVPFGEEGLRLHVALVSLHALLLLSPSPCWLEGRPRLRRRPPHRGAGDRRDAADHRAPDAGPPGGAAGAAGPGVEPGRGWRCRSGSTACCRCWGRAPCRCAWC